MATIRPFAALRPRPERAEKVAAVPYDVVSAAEARGLAASNPWGFLHVSRAEIDLPDNVDPYSDIVYRKAAENFARLGRECPLVVEESPSLYLYRLSMGGHAQTGIAACFSLDEYDCNVIRKHERTRPDKEDDRTRHMLALGAQTGPVLLTYRDRGEIDRIVERETQEEPLYDFTAADGVSNTLWRITSSSGKRLLEEFDRVPVLYIADGHHRAASASRARRQMLPRTPMSGGDEEFHFFLAVAFPAGQLRVLPYNRVVKDLHGHSPEQFLSALKERFMVTESASPSPVRRGEVSIYMAGRWHGLGLKGQPGDLTSGIVDRIASALDVSLLQEQVLGPLLGIQDVRMDRRIDFVGGIRGTRELERLVDEGRAAAAFSMFPVSVEELMAISDAGEIMPPKSTWFEPKLRDGLLIHRI